MSARDRMVVIVLAAAAILAAAYLGVVSPERKKASELAAKVSEARQSLSAAEAKLTEAKSAQRRYAAAYATIVTLGEAVPADGEVPSLLYELDHIAGHVNVEFQTISASGSSASSSASSAEASLASAGFQQLPFSFTFEGSFFDLYHLMQRLQGLTVSLPSGGVNVKGRLLTIQSVSLSGGGSAAGSSSNAGSSAPKEPQMTGTVTATAYVLPPGEALTAGASPAGPAGTTAATASEPTSSTAAAPAVVKAP